MKCRTDPFFAGKNGLNVSADVALTEALEEMPLVATADQVELATNLYLSHPSWMVRHSALIAGEGLSWPRQRRLVRRALRDPHVLVYEQAVFMAARSTLASSRVILRAAARQSGAQVARYLALIVLGRATSYDVRGFVCAELLGDSTSERLARLLAYLCQLLAESHSTQGDLVRTLLPLRELFASVPDRGVQLEQALCHAILRSQG